MISYKRFKENKKVGILIQIFKNSSTYWIIEIMLKHNTFYKWVNRNKLRTQWVKRNLGL